MNGQLSHTETKPLVTIGIPNYNYSQFIITTLNSVKDQTYRNIELIVIDDLSTDNSLSLIDDWIDKYSGPLTIKFIKNSSNLGLTKSCNLILKNANGKYFQTLDADDILLPHKIEKQVEIMERSINTALIYSNIGVVNEDGVLISTDYLARIGYNKNEMPAGRIFEKLIHFNFIPLPSVLIDTTKARKVGGFNETLQVQDYYMWLKLSEQFETIYLPENTALYRQHNKSMSNNSLTSPSSVDSVLNIKFSYYKEGNPEIRKTIRKNIFPSAAFLYQYNYPTAKKWLRRNFLMNPGIKSSIYYVAIKLGIPYAFLSKIRPK